MELVYPYVQELDLTTIATISKALSQPTVADTTNFVQNDFLLSSQAGLVSGTRTSSRIQLKLQEVLAPAYRQSTMLAEFRMQTALADIIPSALRTAAEHYDDHSNVEGDDRTADHELFTKLVSFVWGKLSNRQPITVSSHVFMPSLQPPTIAVYGVLDMFPTKDVLIKHVPLAVMSILRCWLHMPDTYETQGRRYFLRVILENLGSEALLVPAVWDAYEELPQFLQQRSGNTYLKKQKTTFSRDAFSLLQSIFDIGFPAAVHGSKDRKTLYALGVSYRSLRAHIADYANRPVVDLGPDHAVSSLGLSTQQKWRVPPTCMPHVKAIQTVLLLCVAGWNAAMGHKQDDPLVIKIRGNSDLYQPLREYATSRTKINGNAGGDCLDRNFARSRSGLFTFLLFRNVLYHSPYLLDQHLEPRQCRTVFQSGEDFIQHVQLLRSDPTYPRTLDDAYFCSRNAYSKQTVVQRCMQNWAVCWDAANNSRWEVLHSRGINLSWKVAAEFLNGINKQHVIPGCGKLTMYLILTDMVLAGVVDQPSALEVGADIASRREGSYKALVTLGYLDNSSQCVTSEEVARGFEAFYSDVEATLTSTNDNNFEWSPIVAEHTLCKVGRLYSMLVKPSTQAVAAPRT